MILHRKFFVLLFLLLPLFAFGLWCLYGFVAVLGVESAPYTVSSSADGYEIRDYQEMILATTVVDGEFETARAEGFSRLFAYISGDNTVQRSIVMTAPVMTTSARSEEGSPRYGVSFVLPSSESMATLPLPNDPEVRVQLVPEHAAAVSTFYGTVDTNSMEAKMQDFASLLEKDGYTVSGSLVLAQYNPPYTPWFMCKNELWATVLRER